MKNKTIIAIAALSLVLCCAIGGTLAYLLDKTTPVVNTFTYGDINITLTESTGNEYKMVPGNTITKDPEVTVDENSEACWLFVKVEKSSNYGEYLEEYVMADGWNALNGVEGVYYREVNAATAEMGTSYAVLEDDRVNVKTSVTKAMMNAIDGFTVDADGNAIVSQDELDERPTLTFTAYAVQKDNVNSAAEAWEIAAESNS